MAQPPRVSVLLPAHNAAPYLEEAVASVLAQTFQDFELLLIDDGSTDQTPEIATRLAASDPRIRLIRQEQSGLVAALNHGLALARGEYLARMDADDRSLPTRFAAQVAFLDANPEVAVVGGWGRLIDRNGHSFGEKVPPTAGAKIQRMLSHGRSPIIHSAATLRRSALEEVGGYDPGYPHAEDLALWLRLTRQGYGLANLGELARIYHQGP